MSELRAIAASKATPEAVHRTASERLAFAQGEVVRIVRQGKRTEAVLATGFPEIDTVLPRGGMALGAVHEVIGLAARRFVVRMLGRCFRDVMAPALWVVPAAARHSLYGPGLVGMGVDPSRLVIARYLTLRDGLWALEEALKSGAFAVVLGELDGVVGATPARRLQLAAETGGGLGLLLSEGLPRLSAPEFATSRWRADPAPAMVESGITRRMTLTLERYRGVSRDGVQNGWTVSEAETMSGA